MSLVCDIGGTFARFGVITSGAISNIQKLRVDDFDGLQDAIQAYGVAAPGALRIATAAYPDAEGLWRFVNENPWVIDVEALRGQGWDVEIIMNDFEAATCALKGMGEEDVKVLYAERGARNSRCILGPGTGLGLGYLHAGDVVQKTHGGHMPIASLNDEHGQVIKALRAEVEGDVVFEHIVSGPGLMGLKGMYDDAAAYRLFHEFMGVFAATALVAGHAYGGLYLTGGVLDRLEEEGRFDFKTFHEAMCFGAVDSVREALEATPIYKVTDPYPALKGLIHAC